MPADRRKPISPNMDYDDSMWASSSGSSSSIAFAANVTPYTFNEPPVLPYDATSCESSLMPSSVDDCPTQRRGGHGRKKPENYIPRPPNAFILFRSSFIKNQLVSNKVETNHSTLSKIIGLTWSNLPDEERQVWHRKAKVALADHKMMYPDYAFKPVHGKNKEKRRVREVGLKDLKRCEKIAQLLVNGKKGEDLDVAVEEFDKNHAPELVMRFEQPMTTENFAKGSSPVFSLSTTALRKPRNPRRSASRKPSSSMSPAVHGDLYFCTPEPETVEEFVAPELGMESYPILQDSFAFAGLSLDHMHGLSYQGSDVTTSTTSATGEDYQFPSNTFCDTRPSHLSIDTSMLGGYQPWTQCDSSSSPLSAVTTNSLPMTPYGDQPESDMYHSEQLYHHHPVVEDYPHHEQVLDYQESATAFPNNTQHHQFNVCADVYTTSLQHQSQHCGYNLGIGFPHYTGMDSLEEPTYQL